MSKNFVQIECQYCKKTFNKKKSDYNRNISNNRKSYCSRKCAGKDNVKNFGKDNKGRRDKFTGFRWYLRKALQRNHVCDLTLEYLQELFNKQGGKCVYSKVDLTHPKTHKKNNHIYSASLDRIDSNKGYIKGNVQYISMAMNHMKSDMTDEKTRELIEIIKNLK